MDYYAPQAARGRNVASALQMGKGYWEKAHPLPRTVYGKPGEKPVFQPKPSEGDCISITRAILSPVCSSCPRTTSRGLFQAWKEARSVPRLSLCAQHLSGPSRRSGRFCGAILSPTLPSSAGNPAVPSSSSSSLTRSLEAVGRLPCPG